MCCTARLCAAEGQLFHFGIHLVSLQELVKTELLPVHTALQVLLDEVDDDNNDDKQHDLGNVNASLKDLQALLVTQAKSTADCKAAIETLTAWHSSTTLFQNADVSERKNLLLQLSNEVFSVSVQQQVQKVGDDVAAVHANFAMFGSHELKELNSNHTELRGHIRVIADTANGMAQEQEAARQMALEV